jgi:MFS family permease
MISTIAPTASVISGVNTKTREISIHKLGIGQIISWGTLYYSFPLIAENMSRELSISKPETYGAATVGLLTSACFGYPIGRAIDKGRGRNVMVAGSLLAGLLMLVWSHTSAFSLFFVIALLLGLVQSMTLYEAAFAIVANNTANKMSDSITRLTLWGGFASTVFVPLTEILIRNFGWRNALVVLGIFNFVVAALYYATVPKTRPRPSLERSADSGSRSPVQINSINSVLKSQVFWALLVAFTLYSLIFSGLSFHIYPLFSSLNLSTVTVAAVMTFLGPAQVLGRLLLWRTHSNQMDVAQFGGYVFFAFPASVLAIIFLSPFWGLVTFVIVYGIANGIMTIIRGTTVPEMLSNNNYGSINSLISVPSTLSKALGPFALAWFSQRFGSYVPALIGMFCITILILLSYWYALLKTSSKLATPSGR